LIAAVCAAVLILLLVNEIIYLYDKM